MESRYVVSGMTCQHCVAHVTEEVSAISGVDQVSVALADGTMAVSSQSPVDFGAIQAAVAEAGDYSVTPA